MSSTKKNMLVTDSKGVFHKQEQLTLLLCGVRHPHLRIPSPSTWKLFPLLYPCRLWMLHYLVLMLLWGCQRLKSVESQHSMVPAQYHGYRITMCNQHYSTFMLHCDKSNLQVNPKDCRSTSPRKFMSISSAVARAPP